MELYFQDHSFVPLFIQVCSYYWNWCSLPTPLQENYLKPEPAKVRNEDGPEKSLKLLRLMDRAASSLSDGDLVDGLIHRYEPLAVSCVGALTHGYSPEQHWSLMPLHAVVSTIRPASFMYGQGAHYGGPNSIAFPQ